MYQFSLEPVLQHRLTIEENLQRELADIQQHQLRMRRQEDELEQQRQKLYAEIRQRHKFGITISEGLTFADFSTALNLEIELLKVELQQLERKVEKKRQELLEAVKNRKILDKLKERQTIAYQGRLQKKEQDFLDEMGMNAFYRENRR